MGPGPSGGPLSSPTDFVVSRRSPLGKKVVCQKNSKSEMLYTMPVGDQAPRTADHGGGGTTSYHDQQSPVVGGSSSGGIGGALSGGVGEAGFFANNTFVTRSLHQRMSAEGRIRNGLEIDARAGGKMIPTKTVEGTPAESRDRAATSSMAELNMGGKSRSSERPQLTGSSSAPAETNNEQQRSSRSGAAVQGGTTSTPVIYNAANTNRTRGGSSGNIRDFGMAGAKRASVISTVLDEMDSEGLGLKDSLSKLLRETIGMRTGKAGNGDPNTGGVVDMWSG